ncbi:MAG: aspartate 1-decarboxylase [Verrucomicrobiales bacterium]
MLRHLLKSKIHRAVVTDSDVGYEGSIGVPADLMRAVDLWEGEKVLVASITRGERLETYVIAEPEGSGKIVARGGAAHRISTGDIITIMAFTWSERPVESRRILCGPGNVIERHNVS